MAKTCKSMSAFGRCKLHKLQCGYPKCLTEEAIQPTKSEPVKVKDYVLINGMHFSHHEILEWREKEVAYMDRHADDIAVDNFAQAMKNKLAEMRERAELNEFVPDV